VLSWKGTGPVIPERGMPYVRKLLALRKVERLRIILSTSRQYEKYRGRALITGNAEES